MELTPVDVQKTLLGVRWPATKSDLVKHVIQAGAPEEVVAVVRSLPERSYASGRHVVAHLDERS